MKTGLTLVLICLLTVTGCAAAENKPAGAQKFPSSATSLSQSAGRGEPFAGLWLADSEHGGAIVLGVVAGPAAVAGLRADDRILRVGDIDVDASRALQIIESSSPGTRLTLQVMRETAPMAMTLIIDERERWATPSAFRSALPFTSTGLTEAATVPDLLMNQVLTLAPEGEAIVARLEQMFSDLARDDTGYHKLPLIRAAMLNPATMNIWRNEMTENLHPFEFDSRSAVEAMCSTLALQCPQHDKDASTTPSSLDRFAQVIAAANIQVREVFTATQSERAQVHANLRYLMQTTAADRTLIGQPDVLRGIQAMQLSMRVNLAPLLNTAQRLLENAARPPERTRDSRDPPSGLAGIVEGEILDYVELDGGYIVIGGRGPNRYDMDRIYAVVDADGDDVYEWGERVPRETQTIIDMNGNDRYHAATGGPAAGWLGVSVLIDFAGTDEYQSTLGGCGAGAFGFGFLFDYSGADIYRCAAWSVGSGLYGGGALVDLGEDNDVYDSQVFSQGVGGPRGMGILIDSGGDDVYRANGPVRSAYGTPGSFMAFSQGVGVGIRPYDFGGVGLLLDYAGDDRYEGGEFSQGGGYYWGIGMLTDESGNDFYYGNRYAQGFAAHQAFGMLTDYSGDDVYWSMSAAGQGAAWDQSIAVLFEGGGNDVYRGQMLSQGAAAQQARAMLQDVAGDDVYWSSGDVAQGVAGDNSYHFQAEDPVYSFGVLFDESGADRYSTGVVNGEKLIRRETGNSNNGRGIAGVAVDLK